MTEVTTAKVSTQAIDDALAPAVAAFLHTHMNQRFSVEQWQQILTTTWLEQVPNYGFALLDSEQRVVGAICALYSRQWLNGEWRSMCNPHTWCVLPEYRKSSISVVLATIKQAGYHFTMFTPNQSGLEIFAYLRFKPLDKGLRWLPNLPLPTFRRQTEVIGNEQAIQNLLPAHDWQVYQDHKALDGVFSLVVQAGQRGLLLLMKRQKFKRTQSVQFMYVSDYSLMATYWKSIRKHLLLRFGFVFSRVEERFLPAGFNFNGIRAEGHQRFYLSDQLRPEDIQYIYSEMVAMRL